MAIFSGYAYSMIGIRNDVFALIKQFAPEIASIQCVVKHWRTGS